MNREQHNAARKAIVQWRVNQRQGRSKNFPLLASPQGGVAASSRISAKPPKPTQPGWFSALCTRKTTPSSLSKDASRHFLDRSATPPCGDARRGLLRLRPLSNNPSWPGYTLSGLRPFGQDPSDYFPISITSNQGWTPDAPVVSICEPFGRVIGVVSEYQRFQSGRETKCISSSFDPSGRVAATSTL